MDFVAVDVETANPDVHSICQIGIAGFHDGKLVESWQSLIDPQTRFDRGNIAVHGIEPGTVKGAPTLAEVFDEIRVRFQDMIVASHTPFDRRAIAGAAERYGLDMPPCRWLDTAKVVRRAWPEFAKKGYGLANLARRFEIVFNHHDALEDARAAGEVLLRAVGETGVSVEQWLLRTTATSRKSSLALNRSGPLYGQLAVFTGMLRTPRREITRQAADAGCDVATALGETVTLLVVGDGNAPADIKSAKHRRAEQMVRRGHPLRIVGEAEFLRLLGSGR